MATSLRAAAQAALQPLISRAHDHLSALAVRFIVLPGVLWGIHCIIVHRPDSSPDGSIGTTPAIGIRKDAYPPDNAWDGVRPPLA